MFFIIVKNKPSVSAALMKQSNILLKPTMFEDDFSNLDTAVPPIIKRICRKALLLKNSDQIVYGKTTICIYDINV